MGIDPLALPCSGTAPSLSVGIQSALNRPRHQEHSYLPIQSLRKFKWAADFFFCCLASTQLPLRRTGRKELITAITAMELAE